MKTDRELLPQDFVDIFQNNPAGMRIFNDLVKRYYRVPYVPGAAEADRQTAYNCGAYAVVHYLINMMERAEEEANG